MITFGLFTITVFICLFILFSVARHDFVLIRQGISLRQVFDNGIISLFGAFLFGRIFFAIDSGSYGILSPLKFFYLTKNPGILIFAGILGLFLLVFLLFRQKKNKLRIFDIYFISFFPLTILDVVLRANFGISIILKAISLIVLLSFYFWFIKVHSEFTTRDGVITFLGFVSYSLVLLAFSFARAGVFSINHIILQALILVIMIFSSLMLFFIQKDKFGK